MGRGQPLGERGPMAERYVARSQRRETRPYPEWERQGGSVRSAAAAVHQAMKLLPGPGKPETKNTTAHSDQKLFKENRHITPAPGSRHPQGRAEPPTPEAQRRASHLDLPLRLAGLASAFRGQLALLRACSPGEVRPSLLPQGFAQSLSPLQQQVYQGGQ